jgi:RimJ/RimL family protein N-acetyltransferase
MIVTDERVALFVSEQLNTSFCPPFTTMGLERDGQIIAGCIFNVFEKPDLHISVAGHGWTRGFFRAVGYYVFGQLGYSRMTALTESTEVVRLAERIGGEIEGCLRSHYGPGRDGFIVGILREDWKF